MSTDVQADIFAKLKVSFPCAAKYEKDVMMLLSVHLVQAHNLNRHSVTSIIKGLHLKLGKDKRVESKVMFNAVFLYIMIRQVNLPETEDTNAFLQRYPEFSDIGDAQEISAIMQFRSILNVAQLIFDPSKGKKNLLHMVDRVCGGMHIPGFGQPDETNRRVLIYERETGVAFRKAQVIASRSGSLTDDSILSSPFSGTFASPVAVITPPAPPLPSPSPPPPQAPLMGRAPHTIDSAEDTDGSREHERLHQEQEAHTQRLLEEGRAFWHQHARRMEAGRDIPCVFVAPEYAYAAFAYPPHDLGNTNPAQGRPQQHHNAQAWRLPQYTSAPTTIHAPPHLQAPPLQRRRMQPVPQNADYLHSHQATYASPQVRHTSHPTNSHYTTPSNNTPHNARSQW